ncbi:hypothetical protein EUTSA_v10014558mg [Eutrema salsugineum]|uniref:DUF7804 domain-containing protein n=1 Tax=Eutrema salsugineum TaxID=72664 RepID=V4KR69_EUTSA|nr:uncharacterized protein LOC18019553 [Eutrema salsugineum]ESQ40440.1 hypothetical protein EUTSA_v10014558mg [Eutrema salsugineum]
MAAYAKIGYGGSYLVHRGVLEFPCGSDHIARSSFPINSDGNRRSNIRRITASMAEAVSEIEKQRGKKSRGGKDGRAVGVAREKLDRWMKESVTEIVKNLSQAPLLVHLYAGEEEEGTVVVMKAEEWAAVKGRWERGEAEMPEGMIFVEQLGAAAEESCGCGYDGGDGTRAWGLVVQGKGVECGPVCYLLKTTRVGSGSGSGSGMGMLCTHFCLAKVSSFRETSESQLRNCWLVGN